MRAYERFLRYAQVNTQSSETTGETPSTDCQLVLAELLAAELNQMGVDARVDAHGYVYARIPATQGLAAAPTLGFIAHMDTAPAFSGENVQPIVHEHYDGGDIALPKEGRVLRVKDFPHLAALKGQTIITADGSTLLGADDKAGIAVIITACERLLASGRPHGEVCIAFTPDEEIGEGADHFDVQGFGADYAFTLDGDAVGGIEYENFNAASAVIDITGVSVHPGSAKGIMENALTLAMEVNAQLPAGETPADTEGRAGFYFLELLSGDAAQARMTYIIRDHDAEKFAARKAEVQRAVDAVQAAHPTAHLTATITDQYYNMIEQIKPCMHLVDNACAAIRKAGAEPVITAIRGGTDGARLSYMGLPCPNLGVGGDNFHGPYEYVVVEQMDTAVNIVLNLVNTYAGEA